MQNFFKSNDIIYCIFVLHELYIILLVHNLLVDLTTVH
jgi:hypothetical protein